ncbi:MAG: glycoside hydrolase family 127 protein [Planctomycetaceae bacterium]|nr:glycoside hydrolase family 127 protein [Planctomycetaceae bacterium]
MKTMIRMFLTLVLLTAGGTAFTQENDQAVPKVRDALQRVTLNGQELGGEINRRINDLIDKNYMVVDVDADWLDHFRFRKDRGNTGFVYYGIGKLIDAGSLFTAYSGDPGVAARTQYLIDELRKTRDPSGYLGFWTVEPDNKQDHINWILHEQEYITLALVRHYRATGNQQSLEDAKIMADYIRQSFPKNEDGIYYIEPGISIAGICEAFVELYQVTGDEKYWDYAQNLQYELHWCYEPYDEWVKKTPYTPFHLYVMLSHLYPELERYRYSTDDELLKKSHWMLQELLEEGHGAMLVTGSSSQGEYFTYNQDGAGAVEESCVTAYLLREFDSLMRLEGDMRLGNLMERTIYNALFAAQSPDGRQICYFTPFTGKRTFQTRDTFCCNGNFRRAVAEIPQKVFYRTNEGGIALNLFTDVKKSFDINGTKVEIAVATDYPGHGEVDIVFDCGQSTPFAFRFRAPAWCEKMTATLTDKTGKVEKVFEIEPTQLPLGYFEMDRTWNSGDHLHLSMPMDLRLIRGRETQAGRVALLRGPVIFCIGEEWNSHLLEKVPQVRDLVIDPASLGDVQRDSTIRPQGQKVTARAWTNPERTGEQVEVVLTEFVDPSGLDIYFKIPNLNDATPVRLMDDELFFMPRVSASHEVLAARYGPKASGELAPLFEIQGKTIASLANDYVAPAGQLDSQAIFQDSGKTGTWMVGGLRDRKASLDAPGNLTVLNSSRKVYATPLGFAYGGGSADGLGFIANHTPSDKQENLWRQHFTSSALDRAIPADDRENWLLTHPLADKNSAVVVRWQSDHAVKHVHGVLIDASVCSLATSNGVAVEVTAENDQGEKLDLGTMLTKDAANISGCRVVTWNKWLPPGSWKSIEFRVNNNGDHNSDSTALRFSLLEPDEPVLQSDVFAKFLTVFEGKKTTELGDFSRLFGDDSGDTTKTLKLKLRSRLTGEISWRELTHGTVLEL